MLVTQRGGELTILTQFQRAFDAGRVAVGGGVAFADGAAAAVIDLVLGAGAQAKQVHGVNPVAMHVLHVEAAIEAFADAVAAGRGEAQLAAPVPWRDDRGFLA